MWPILHTRRAERHFGFAIPCFINNMDRHLATFDVYANGSIDAWGGLDLAFFRRKLRRRWVVPDAPVSADLSVFNLGGARVEKAEWNGSAEKFWEAAIEALRQLNPSLENLIDFEGEDVVIRNGVRHAKLGLMRATPWKSGAGGEILGDSVPVFAACNGDLRLQPLFVFSDETCRLGSGGPYESLESALAKLQTGELTTSAPDGKWIEIEGLGRFVGQNGYWQVKKRDRSAEIHDKLRVLQGGQSRVEECRARFDAYEENPDETTRQLLREAYERVPEHLRMYCGDMDSKDWPIRRAIYGAEA